MANEVNPVFIPFVASATNPNPPAPLGAAEVAGLNQIGTALTNGPNAMLALNMARQRGNDLGENAVYDDWSQLDPIQFADKYGYDIYDQMSTLVRNQGELARLNNRDRDTTQILGDSANSIATGLVGGLGDITTLGAGLINDDAGRFVAGLTHDFREGMQGYQSTEENQRRFLNGIAAQLDEIDNTAAYDASIAEGNSELQATLGYLGRGFINGAYRLYEDPSNLGTGVAEGVGSLLAGGYAGRGAQLTLRTMGRQFARETTEDIVRESVERSAATVASRTLSDRLTMPLVIGGMEGGNAYGSAVSQVMAMSHEQLMGSSEEYRSLVSSGTEPDQAREEVAAQAGMTAAMIAAPAGAATGMLVSRFEANPFARQSVKTMTGNLGREAVEEGTQGLTGQLGTNTGLAVADNTVQPLEGAGDAISEGAILGSLTAGAVQSPRLARAAAVGTARAGIDALIRAGQRAVDRVNETEGVNDTEIARVLTKVAAETPTFETDVTDIVTNIPEKGIADIVDPVDVDVVPVDASKEEAAKEILDSAGVGTISRDPDDEFVQSMHPALRDAFTGKEDSPKTRLDLANALANMVADTSGAVTDEGRMIGALTLQRLMTSMQETLDEDLPLIAKGLKAADVRLARMQKMMTNLNTFMSSPRVTAALAMAQEAKATSEDINMELAKTDPVRVDEAMAKKTLYSDGQKARLTPQQRRSLSLALKLKSIAKELLTTTEAAKAQENEPARPVLTDEASAVNRQITDEGGSLNKQYSLNQYAALINENMAVGRTIASTRLLERMLNFNQHMANKVQAWNDSMTSGNRVEYDRFGPNGRALDKPGVVKVHKDDPASLAMGRQIYAEAKALHDLYDEMRRLYPQLKIKGTSTLPVLDAGFNAPAPAGKPATPAGPEVSRITPEQAGRATEEQLLERMNRIQARNQEGKYETGDAATLEVLSNEVTRRLEEDTKTKKAAKKAAETATMTAALTDEIHQNAYDKMVKLVDSNKRVLLSEFTPEERLSLSSKWGVDVKRKYGYLSDGLFNRVVKTSNATTAPVVKPEITNKVEARFPLLLKTLQEKTGRLLSRFSETFRFPSEATSRMQNQENYYGKMLEIVSDRDTPLEETFGTLGFEDNTKTRNNILRMLGMTRELANAVQKQFMLAYESNEYLKKRIDDGLDVSQMQRYRVAALIEERPNGKLGFNPDLIMTAAMAAVHWRLNSGYMTQNMSLEDIAKMLDMSQEEALQYQEQINSGMTMNIAVQSLSETIRKFWGVEANPDVGDGIVKGITEGLAKEFLRAMQDQVTNLNSKGQVAKGETLVEKQGMGLLTIKKVGDTNLYIVAFKPNPSSIFTQIEANLQGDDFFLADATIIGKWDKGIYIGAPSTENQRTQVRRPQVPLTSEQNAARRGLESTPYYANTVLANVIEKAGEEAVRLFRGGTQMMVEVEEDFNFDQNPEEMETKYKELDLNAKHKLSVAGKNLTLFTSFNDTMRLLRMLKASTVEGDPTWGKPVFFGWGINSLGRFQMFGRSNPESDKLMRDVIISTINTLDMSDPNGAHARGFWKAIAQGLGVKTHKVYNRESMPQLIEDTKPGGRFYAAVQAAMKAIQQGENLSQGDAKGLLDLVANTLGDDSTVQALTAIMEVAKLKLAEQKNDPDALKKFQTVAYMEADGINNGPFFALLRYGIGAFSSGWIEMVQRGGLLFGSIATTMNDFHNNNKDKKLSDIYLKVAAKASEYVNAQYLDATNDVVKHFDAMKRVMSALKISVVPRPDGGVDITRIGAKNPVTISVYASSLNGMNKKVRFEVEKAIAAHISETMQYDTEIGSLIGDQQFRDDLVTITGQALVMPTKGSDLSIMLGPKSSEQLVLPKSKEDRAKFVFSLVQSKILEENLYHYYTKHLYRSIDELMLKHMAVTTKTMLMASKVQSLIMSELFKTAVLERMVEKELNPTLYPEYKRNDGLTQKELRKIWADLMPYAPVVETGSQNFMVGGGNVVTDFGSMTVKGSDGKSKTVKMPETYSSDLLKNGLETNTGYFGPEPVGVGIIPIITIGTGDALAMQKLYAKVAREKGLPALSVYDGLHINVERLQEIAQKMNEAVVLSLQENPLEAMSKNFDIFLENNIEEIVAGLSKSTKIELTRAFEENMSLKEPMSNDDMMKRFDWLQKRLANVAEATAIRMETIMSVPFSMDQMSGAELPFQNEGTAFGREAFANIDINSTPAEVEAALNKVREEVIRLRQIRKATEAKRDAAKDARVMNLIQEEARQVKSLKDPSGAIVMPAWHLIRLLKGKLPLDHWKALELVLASPRSDDFEVVIGSREEVDAYQKARYKNTFDENEQQYKGKYDVENDRVYIVDVNSETIAHELLHAVFTKKLAAYYLNRTKLRPEEIDAIKRIELLLEEFLTDGMDLNPSRPREDQMAYNGMKDRLLAILSTGDRITAMGEFISYMMSDESLVRLAKQTKVKSKLVILAEKVFEALKDLIWGKAVSVKKEIGDNFYENLRFNLQIISVNPNLNDTIDDQLTVKNMYQTKEYGRDGSLDLLQENLTLAAQKLYAHSRLAKGRTKAEKVEYLTKVQKSQNKYDKNLDQAKVVADSVIGAGFDMNMQQRTAFHDLVAVMFSDMLINRNSMSRMQDVYDHFIANVKENAFRKIPELNDGSVAAENDKAQAKQKMDAITGKLGVSITPDNQSDLLAVFVGLAMVHPDMKAVLEGMQMPKLAVDFPAGTPRIDQFLTKWGTEGMERLDRWASGEGNRKNVADVMDSLVGSMLRNKLEQETYIETSTKNVMNKTDKWLSDFANQQMLKLSKASSEVAKAANNRLLKKAAQAVQAVSGLMTKEVSSGVVRDLISMVNKDDSFLPLREVLIEVVGLTDENKKVYKLINITRKMVDQIRQQFRDELPQLIKNKFKKAIDTADWAAFTTMLGHAEVAILMNAEGKEQTLRYIEDGRAGQGRMVALKNQIEKLDPRFNETIIRKADQLANWMMTREVGPSLQRNPEAIAKMYGETGFKHSSRKNIDLKELEGLIEQYVSLKALSLVDDITRSRVRMVLTNQPESVGYLLDILTGIRNDEMKKARSGRGQVNRFMGYIRGQNQEGSEIIVAPLKDAPDLVLRGYTKLGDYVGSNNDLNRGKMAYYYAPVSGLVHFNQGIIQNTRSTFSGVDPETGFSMDQVAGRITGRAAQVIAMQRRADTGGAEALMPIWDDETGAVVAYERALDPQYMKKLNSNTNLAELMGAWRGRQMEEAMAQEVNHQSIKAVHSMWEDGVKAGRQKEFVDLEALTRAEDPVMFEAWRLIPKHVKEEIFEVYGERAFWVRRDMRNTVVGTHAAMVSDFWTGQSRMTPDNQTRFKNAALGAFGAFGKEAKAYTSLMTAQQFWQGIVSDARHMIVVKSIIVPAANLLSNMKHLSNVGVGFRQILVGVARKTAETNDYMKRRRQEIELDSELLAARGRKDEREVIKLSNRLQAIRDSYKKLSIWPLIEAGEFSSISAGGFDKEQAALSEGRWGSIIETLQDKLPAGLKTPYRYALLTKDTPIYRAMSLATQYGDFVAKSILYDHMVQNEGKTQTEALERITEEFVNYNFYAGRTRAVLESLGMTWFFSYKLRSIKVAGRTLRDHPLKSIMMMSINPEIPLVGNVGSPFDDNMITVLADGSWDYSTGPGMIKSAGNLHPWWNLVQ
jgi:hypothetical protein